MNRAMIAMSIAFSLSTSAALAAEDQKLTVEQVVQINSALSQLNCANRIIKDGAKETQVCDSYKWSSGMVWMIATNQRKTQDIVLQYSKVRNQAIAGLPRKSDGNPTDEAAVKFAVQDREWLDGKADVALDHFKKVDIEPMNLPPALISALLPIID